MAAKDLPFEGFLAAGGGFDEQKMFSGGFDFSLPAVNGFNFRTVDVDAGGKVFLDDRMRDFPRFTE
jgi:hypothetical protein